MAKYIGILSSDARGSIGGNTLSRNTYGVYIRRRVSPVQPRTDRQVNNRAEFAAWATTWRNLPQTSQNTFNSLAKQVKLTDTLGNSYNPSGFQLYVSLNRNIARIGGPALTVAPPTAPSLPELTNFAASATITTGKVSALNIAATNSEDLKGQHIAISATGALGPGVNFIAPSLYRTIGTVAGGTNGNIDVLERYNNVFGTPGLNQKLAFRAWVIDDATGFAGVPSQALTIIPAA